MEKFDIHILGCGSALPTLKHHPTSQVLNIREKLFMIDCGEGTQQNFRRTHLKFSRLNHIFISHLHGDHCFGLIGLVSTLNLLGRTNALYIYGPSGIKEFLMPQIDFFCPNIAFEVIIKSFSTKKKALIYEDRTLTVHSIPLRHRLPTMGFYFEERAPLPHIRRDMIDFLKIPIYAINSIKQGADWITEDGAFYPNEHLVFPATPARKYAYLSDTCFVPENADLVKGATLLYHEATFLESEAKRAEETQHSTAKQAAEFAKLADVQQLLIGHYSGRYDSEDQHLSEAQTIFPNTLLAQEGLCISI